LHHIPYKREGQLLDLAILGEISAENHVSKIGTQEENKKRIA
jgi:hypothetical protein